MNKILQLFLIFILITNCSFHEGSKFWSSEKITKEKNLNSEVIFREKEATILEFNPNLKITLSSKFNNNSFFNTSNNDGRINYSNNPENKSKYKFSKIKNFYEYEPEIIFNGDNVIFFDNKGTILNFDSNSKLIWKKNYYSKNKKKQNPILFYANNKDYLVVVDTIAKFYVLDINSGKLLWSKKNSAPFNSQIKIYKDKFYVTDFENILKGYDIKNGKEVLSIKTENSLIRSQQKLSMIIENKKIYFNNTLGDISSVDINSGELIWQTPTQSNLAYDESFLLKTSDIVADKESLYFSNNKNQFFSLDLQTGAIKWKQEINSNLRASIIDGYLFIVTMEGYLVIIDKNLGNIIRITDIFNKIKMKQRSKIQPTGFIVTKNDIFITTSHGRLLKVDIKNGKTKSIIKIDNNKISRPSVLNKDMFIITDNSIIKLN